MKFGLSAKDVQILIKWKTNIKEANPRLPGDSVCVGVCVSI